MFYLKERRKRNQNQPHHAFFAFSFFALAATSFSICFVQRLANSSSVNLLADCLAR